MRTLTDSQLEELFEVAVDRCGAEVNFADDFRSTTVRCEYEGDHTGIHLANLFGMRVTWATTWRKK